MAVTAISLATSPAAAPPIPSDTIRRLPRSPTEWVVTSGPRPTFPLVRSAIRKASSLPPRCLPTSVRAKTETRMSLAAALIDLVKYWSIEFHVCDSRFESKKLPADQDYITGFELRFSFDPDESAIAAGFIHQDIVRSVLQNPRVVAGHQAVMRESDGTLGTPYTRFVLDLIRRPGILAFDKQSKPRPGGMRERGHHNGLSDRKRRSAIQAEGVIGIVVGAAVRTIDGDTLLSRRRGRFPIGAAVRVVRPCLRLFWRLLPRNITNRGLLRLRLNVRRR